MSSVYSVTVTATDDSGHSAAATVFYEVPSEAVPPPGQAYGYLTRHGSAVGIHPTLGNSGQGVGRVTKAGSAVGVRPGGGAANSANGAVTRHGSATGIRTPALHPQGSATGRVTKAGSAVGVKPGSTGGRPYLAYTVDSFFRSRTTGAPINAARTAEFITFQKTFVDADGMHASDYAYPRLQGVQGNLWGTGFALGVASDPIWKITGTLTGTAAVKTLVGTTGFHAPENFGTLVTGTSDSPMCCIDSASGVTVFVTNAEWNSTMGHTIRCNAGSTAATWHTSNGLDARNPRGNDARNWTSRGRISDAMVVRRDEVDYAIKNNTDCGHVLHCFIMESRSGFCHPMVADEGARGGWGVEGERVIIRPDVNLTARGLSPGGLAVARTLQNYGMYIGDNAGSYTCIHCEVEYPAHPVWNGLLVQNSLLGLTWDDFAVVNQGWQ